MRHKIWIAGFVLIVMFSLLTGCQQETVVDVTEETVPAEVIVPLAAIADEEGTVIEDSGPASQIKFEKVLHNFGDVGPASNHICEFNFTNTGEGLLKITNISKTCSCTPFKLKKKEYAPGESGTLKVSYHAGTGYGAIKRRLFVSSNDKKTGKVELTIRANIVKRIEYKPERLKLLLNKENAGCPDITLTSLDGKPFSIKWLSSPAKAITADIDSSVQATEFVIKPKVDTTKLAKALNGNLKIRTTHPEGKTIIIPFETLPEFEVSPLSINVLNAESQKPVEREVWILNNYGEDFEIEDISSQKGTIELLSMEKIDNRYKLMLKITPPAKDQKRKVFTDTCYIKIKGGKELKINCRGFYSRK